MSGFNPAGLARGSSGMRAAWLAAGLVAGLADWDPGPAGLLAWLLGCDASLLDGQQPAIILDFLVDGLAVDLVTRQLGWLPAKLDGQPGGGLLI